MDSLRLRGDDLADMVATELHSNHGGFTKINDLLGIPPPAGRAYSHKKNDVASNGATNFPATTVTNLVRIGVYRRIELFSIFPWTCS